MIKAVENIFSGLFSEGNLKKFEKFILISATFGFIIHLLLILLNNNGYVDLSFSHKYLDGHMIIGSNISWNK